jgi:hypothetical protein
MSKLDLSYSIHVLAARLQEWTERSWRWNAESLAGCTELKEGGARYVLEERRPVGPAQKRG